MKICWTGLSLKSLFFNNSVKGQNNTIYFDCIHPDDLPLNGTRAKKYMGKRAGVIYSEVGHNFLKEFVDTRDYMNTNTPKLLYEDNHGHISTEDWCEGDTPPEFYVPQTNEKEILDGVKVNQAILLELQSQKTALVSELQSIKAESVANLKRNTEILLELQSQNNATAAEFKLILSELHNIKSSSN